MVPTGPRAPAFLLVSVIALCAGSSVAQNAQYLVWRGWVYIH